MDDDHAPILNQQASRTFDTAEEDSSTHRRTTVVSTQDVLTEWQKANEDQFVRRFEVEGEEEHHNPIHSITKLPIAIPKKIVSKMKKAESIAPGASEWNPSLRPGVKNSKKEVQVAMKRIGQATKYETINYIEVGSDIQKAWNFERPPDDYWFDDFWRWLNPCIAAFITACIGFMVTMLLKWCNALKFGSTAFFLQRENYVAAYFVYVAFCVSYAFISGALVAFLSPAATGGGIPEVKMFLNGIHVPGILSFKTLIAKMIGIVFTIAGGIIAGKEGPFVHAGAIVGGGVGMLGSDWITRITRNKWNFKAPRWLGGYHRNPVDHRDFTAIGTAIGIAVAFNSPIGGLLFTVEEGASFYSRSSFWRAFLATGIAVMSVNIIFVLMNEADEVSLFGVLHEEIGMGHQFELAGGFFYRLWELPIFAIIGACGGISGALLVIVQSKVGLFRAKYIPPSKSWRRIFEVMFAAFLTANVWFIIVAASPCVDLPVESTGLSLTRTATVGSVKDLDYLKNIEHFDDIDNVDAGRIEEEKKLHDEATEEHQHELRPQLQCPDGQFNKFGQLFFTDLGGALRRMVVLGNEVPNDVIYPWEVVGLYYLMANLMFIWAYGVGAPAGLFVPTLTFGAAFGLFAGHGVKATFGQWWAVPISFRTYAVIGCAAFLGGTTRMIVSVTVLVAETTGAAGLMVPIMVANYCAKLVGDMFNHSIYDFAMFSKGGPVLEEAALFPHQKMIMDKLQASEMMTTHITALPLKPTLGEVIELMRTCTHSTIAVTPTPERALNGQPFELHGVIRQSQLLRLLKYRLGIMTEERRAAHEADLIAKFKAASSNQSNGSFSASHSPNIHLDPVMMQQMLPAMIVAAESHKTNLEMLQMLEEIPVKIYAREQKEILDRYTPEEAQNMIVLIEPFMDRESTVVCGVETLSKTYNMFRTMGHHHVFVTKDKPIVEGLICRKDLLEDIAKLKLGEKANRCKMNVLAEAITLSSIPFLPVEGQNKLRDREDEEAVDGDGHERELDEEGAESSGNGIVEVRVEGNGGARSPLR